MEIKAAIQLLELNVPISKATLKKAYRDALMVWHPDRFTGNTELKAKAEGRTCHINEAYALLSRIPESDYPYREIAGVQQAKQPPPANPERASNGQSPPPRPQQQYKPKTQTTNTHQPEFNEPTFFRKSARKPSERRDLFKSLRLTTDAARIYFNITFVVAVGTAVFLFVVSNKKFSPNAQSFSNLSKYDDERKRFYQQYSDRMIHSILQQESKALEKSLADELKSNENIRRLDNFIESFKRIEKPSIPTPDLKRSPIVIESATVSPESKEKIPITQAIPVIDDKFQHSPTDNRLFSGSVIVNKLQGSGGKGNLTLDNGLVEDAFVKMLRNDRLVASFYVRGGERFNFSQVPDGVYQLLYCTGFGWDAARHDFTRGRHAVRYDEPLAFLTTKRTEGSSIITSSGVITLTLHRVANGNTTTSDISLEEFDRY